MAEESLNEKLMRPPTFTLIQSGYTMYGIRWDKSYLLLGPAHRLSNVDDAFPQRRVRRWEAPTAVGALLTRIKRANLYMPQISTWFSFQRWTILFFRAMRNEVEKIPSAAWCMGLTASGFHIFSCETSMNKLQNKISLSWQLERNSVFSAVPEYWKYITREQ